MFAAMNVPFLDLWRMHEPFASSLGAEFSSLIERGSFVNGAEVAEFESAFAAYCGHEHCVGVSNGLDGAPPGAARRRTRAAAQEVIVPANTFVATVEAVDAGRCARRCWSTCREDDFNLDVRARRGGDHRRGRRRSCRCTSTASSPTCARSATLASRRGLLSSRTRARRTAPRATASAPATTGDCGRVQLLPGEEPRRDGRRRRASSRTTPELAQQSSCAARARPAREVPSRALGLHRAARHDAGARPAARSCRTSTGGTSSVARSRPRYSDELAGVGDLVLPPAAAGSEPVWHLYVVRTDEPGARSPSILASRGDRHGPALPGADPPLGGLREPRLRARRLSGHRAARRDRALAADLPGHDRASRSSRSSTPSRSSSIAG